MSLRRDGEAYDYLVEHRFTRQGPVGSPIDAMSHAMAVAVAITAQRGIPLEEITRSMSSVEIERS